MQSRSYHLQNIRYYCLVFTIITNIILPSENKPLLTISLDPKIMHQTGNSIEQVLKSFADLIKTIELQIAELTQRHDLKGLVSHMKDETTALTENQLKNVQALGDHLLHNYELTNTALIHKMALAIASVIILTSSTQLIKSSLTAREYAKKYWLPSSHIAAVGATGVIASIAMMHALTANR